jgi:xanthine dehydrogenase YagT iron-sulfur-binding subunit
MKKRGCKPHSLPDNSGSNAEDGAPESDNKGSRNWDMTRREFVASAGIVTGGFAVGFPVHAVAGPIGENSASLAITINSQAHELSIDPRVTLLDLLRENLNLTGTKKGCDHGQCGACTVLVNGRRINSCLSLAVVHDGDDIKTIEGFAEGKELHPLQAAFLEYDGLQCGYCTPGQICSASALLDEHKRGDASVVTPDLRSAGPADLTSDEIRERMSGNICRCGAYPGIVAAIQSVRTNSVEPRVKG